MIEVIEYFGDQIRVIHKEKISPLTKFNWVNCVNPSDDEFKFLSNLVGIRERYFRMIVDEDEVPKVISVKNGTMFIIKAPSVEDDDLVAHSFAAIITKNHFITLSSSHIESLEHLKQIPHQDLKQMFSKGHDMFLYELYNFVIKSYFTKLDKIENQIELIEEEVIDKPNKDVVPKIFAIKKTLIYFHKALMANRDVFSTVHQGKYKCITSKNEELFHELVGECSQLIEMIAIFRDVLTGTLEIYMSSVSNNMNEVMKKLTVVASFVLVPTLISGIYGMNFKDTSPWNMPELYWQYGYLFVLGLMITSVIALFVYFKRKKWI